MRLKHALRSLVLASAAGLAGGCSVLAEQRPVILSNAVRGLVLISEPVTVTLTPGPGFVAALDTARQGRGAVALAMEGLEGRATQPIRISVFVDKPDATRATPIEDPHHLGYLFLIPVRGVVRRTGRAFDLTSVDIADAAAPLRVTLVPVVGVDAAPRDASLTVEEIYIRRED
jgi:hypothetical protein